MNKQLERGMEVWVAPISQVHGQPIEEPRRGILMRHEPYPAGKADGWYVSYPDAVEQWDCHGGWNPVRSIHLTHPGPRALYIWEKQA